MGRASSAVTKAKILTIAVVIVLVAAVGVAIALYANSPARKVDTTFSSQHQLTDISYRGQAGVDALSLLKKHASVSVKHYSFGDMVTSINGTPGNGPKYWTFYVNGKMSQVGASAYVTKAGDNLEWKLQ